MRQDPLLRPVLRAAEMIQRQLCQPRSSDDFENALTALDAQHDLMRRAWQKMRQARQRGWHVAAGRVRLDLFFHARPLQHFLDNVLRFDDRPEPQHPSLRLIYDELRQLEDEFQQVQFLPEDDEEVGRTAPFVTATTDPIELEGLQL